MSAPSSDKNPRKPTDDPLLDIIEPALKVGAFSGGAGFLVGGTAGILKSTTPKLFALASAIQCGTLGASFWATRGFILQEFKSLSDQNPSDRTKATAIAGGISGGATGFLFRGRSNALPGFIVMALAGAAGQAVHNRWTATPAAPKEDKPRRGFWESMTSIGIVTHLTNDEYAEMLREKKLKVDVEIAILDDKIAALKKQQAEQPAPEKQNSEN